MSVFDQHESAVRSYCRTFPCTFSTAQGSTLTDELGKTYIDFFAGAGALNYGHNHPMLKQAVRDYMANDGVIHSLDLHTEAKRAFISSFVDTILKPRHMEHRLMFPGPTGTNCVEAALKLARKVTGRHQVAAFTHGFHGMTLGALAATANPGKRAGAGVPLNDIIRLPYDDFFGGNINSLQLIEDMFDQVGSGYEPPAAFLIETVQCEGGLNVASKAFMQGLERLANKIGSLLIIDDIQAGCGRTGPFFSFDDMDIHPHIICLSKSLSGLGLPFSLLLIQPDLDQWEPGEHNGTFRGNNLAFVSATQALLFWRDGTLNEKTQENAAHINLRLHTILKKHPSLLRDVRGRGMVQGLRCCEPEHGPLISKEAYNRGLIIENAGPNDEVVKLLPALIIKQDILNNGLSILEDAIDHVANGIAIN